MTRDTGSFGLYGLGTSYLQSFGSSKRIECHILSLEWGRTKTVLPEYTTKGSCNNTFTYIASRTCKHDRMKFLHKKDIVLRGII